MSPSAGFPGPPRGRRSDRRVRRGRSPRASLSPRSLPVTIKYGLPAALLLGLVFVGVRWGIGAWKTSHARLAVVDQSGNPVVEGTVDFFAYDDSGSAPSPMPILATVELTGPDAMTLGRDRVPGEAVVRVRAPGYGVGFGFVEASGDLEEVRLGPPVSLEGRVVTAEGRAVSEALVIGMGGGPRGVPLVEATSGTDGTFRLEGLSASLASITLRVRRAGYAILHETVWQKSVDEPELRLQTTSPVTGRVEGTAGVELTGLRILVYSLPGVAADVREDGSFRLDFLPPDAGVLLLVHGLPEGRTHRGVRASAGGEDVAIQVTRSATLRGRVMVGETEEPAAGAVVYHEHGPSGRRTATTDDTGWFSLEDLPSGEVWLYASARSEEIAEPDGVRRQVGRSGRRTVEVEEGRDLTGVEIRIY